MSRSRMAKNRLFEIKWDENMISIALKDLYDEWERIGVAFDGYEVRKMECSYNGLIGCCDYGVLSDAQKKIIIAHSTSLRTHYLMADFVIPDQSEIEVYLDGLLQRAYILSLLWAIYCIELVRKL